MKQESIKMTNEAGKYQSDQCSTNTCSSSLIMHV